MRPIVILGPTATGKSDLALRLARRMNGRVIGADSIQVYRGLDAGSCKPDAAARREIPHELIDVVRPDEPFSAGRFARMASEAMDRCRRNDEVPIVAGGTGLYLRALLSGIAPMPPRDENLRADLYERARNEPPGRLHEELASRDPGTASRIGPNDLQRIVRALEVMALTGMPLSEHIRASAFVPDRVPSLKVGLALDRPLLYRRIDRRVDRIFEAGIVEETRRLLDSGVPEGCNALKGLGYREVLSHLRGEADLPRTIELVKRNTRRFARRQISWFRRERDVHWFTPGDEASSMEAIAGEIVMLYSRADVGSNEPGERNG